MFPNTLSYYARLDPDGSQAVPHHSGKMNMRGCV